MNDPNQKKRVGFLGVGQIAVQHALAANELGHHIVAGCATSSKSSSWKYFSSCFPGTQFESQPNKLLASDETDSVVVCLPWNVTEKYLGQMLSVAKPLLIEKPVCLSSDFLNNCLSNPHNISHNKIVGLNRRFYETVSILRDRVNQGGVLSAEIVISETVQRLVDLFGEAIVPYVLIYSSCHVLDAARWILGNLELVKVYHDQTSPIADLFPSIRALLETLDGAPVFLTIASENPLPIGLRILFDDKTTWHLSPMEKLSVYKGYEVVEPEGSENIRQFLPLKIFEETEPNRIKPGFLKQMSAFMGDPGIEKAVTLPEMVGLLEFTESLIQSKEVE